MVTDLQIVLGLAVVLAGVALFGYAQQRNETADADSEEATDQETSEETVEQPTKPEELNRSWGAAFKGVLYTVFVMPLMGVTPMLRALPPTWMLYHKLHKWSAWQMQRAANADALANVRTSNDREDVFPAAYVDGDEDDKNGSGWKIKGLGNKRYDTGVRGGTSSRFGRADLIHINEDDPEQATWTEATIDAAFQLDREKYLFRDATVHAAYTLVGQQNGAAGQQPMADGGANQNLVPQSVDVSLQRPGILEDVLVPVSSPNGYDGQVISFNQFSNIKQEKTDQEAIREAKNSGWMAAKLDDIDGMDMIKIAIIVGVWSFILLFYEQIGAAIAGIGGGGAVSGAASGAGLGMIRLPMMLAGVM